ncbi:MAG: S8 family serine peptidase, partial [Candidatus Eisenbacteria bacterium]|nr:S8 family serine peptidase [Candidatus Eisenbacteria bacterium]
LVHHPAGLQYSAETDYRAYAADSLSLPDCREGVNPTVPLDAAASVWFVIAAWSEAKEFAGIEFGFGHYDEQAYAIVDHGPCFPVSGSELADAGWPGPLAGTTLTAATAWEGAFVPIYYFAGYGYAEGEITIQGRGPGSVARVENESARQFEVRPSRCGVLGIGRPGIAVCPEQGIGQEVLAWFVPGAVELPPGTSHASLASASLPSPAIDSLLARHSVTHVTRTYPGAVKDLVGFRGRSGKRAYLTDLTGRYTFVAPGAEQAASLAEALAAEASVVQAVRNGVVLETLVFPDEFEHDPYQSDPYKHWHLHNVGSGGCVADVDIDAPEAWDIERGDASIRIAIVDNPVAEHEDHRPMFAPCDDGSSHGSNVAGIVGAETDNGIGIAAVDWAASLGCYDVTPHLYPQLDVAGVTNLIASAVADGCRILNCSWGTDKDAAEEFRSAFIDAYKADVMIVAAVGNYLMGPEPLPLAPGMWDQGTLTVGAIDCRGDRADFSIARPYIDVAAPGESLYTTDLDHRYAFFRGTSAAAPVVSGVGSLILAYALRRDLDLGTDDLAQLIRLGAVDLEDAGWDSLTGWGCVNAHNSLRILSDSTWNVFRLLAEGSCGPCNTVTQLGTADYVLCGVPWGADSVFDGRLELTKYEVQREVSLGGPVFSYAPPVVWGRGPDMYGYGLDSFEEGEVLWGYGHCDTMGTATDSTATLRTWVYFDAAGDRWFPCPPEDVAWAYGVFSAADPQGVRGEGAWGIRGPSGLRVGVRSPQHGGATMTLRLPGKESLKVRVFDVQGRLVKTVADGILPAGGIELRWDGRDERGAVAGSGLYWVRVDSPWGVVTRRFIIVM